MKKLPNYIECRKIITDGYCFQKKEKEFVNYCLRELARKDRLTYFKLESIPEIVFLLYDKKEQKYIGMVGVSRPNLVRKLYVIPSERHKGYGTYLSLIAKVYILTFFASIPVSQVFIDNEKMIKFLEKQGMRKFYAYDCKKKFEYPFQNLKLDDFKKFGLMLRKYNVPSTYIEISDLWYCSPH